MDLQGQISAHAYMPTDDHKQRVGAFFRARMAEIGITRRDVERKMGVTYTTAHNWYRGNVIPELERASDLAGLLKVDKRYLLGILTDESAATDHTANTTIDAVAANVQYETVANASHVELPELGPRDVPVMGVAVGGDDAEFYFNGKVQSYVRRPAPISTWHEVYALHVVGTSMWPRYKDGELIYVHRRTPAVGDDVIVELHPEVDGETPRGFIKFLVRRNGSHIICGQYNPACEISYPTDAVKSLHRVIPWHELLAV